MKNEQIRQAVRTLFEQGKKKKEIARFLRIDVKTVRNILDREPDTVENRSDKISIDHDELVNLHAECDGYVQGMHEILTEEIQGIQLKIQIIRICGVMLIKNHDLKS